MNYRTMGRTGIKVSEIGLGCEHLEKKEASLVDSVIDEAYELGINVADVFMPEPNVRTFIGNALKGRRDKFVLQGHIGAVWRDGQYAKSRDVSECKVFVEDFLKRVQTDYIDVAMVHFVDEEADLNKVLNEGILEYAAELKTKGTARALGLSSHNPAVAKKAVETGLVDVLMFSINPAYDLMPSSEDINIFFEPNMLSDNNINGIHPDRVALYRACEEHGTAINVMKTFCGAMLLDAEKSPFKKALTVNQLIHYALTRPAVSSALIGCVSREQMKIAAAYDPASHSNDFSDIFKMKKEYGADGLCVYCNHCLPCPANIDVARVNKYLDMAGPATIKEHYLELSAKAGDCTGCGSCEERCPFNVKVRERMKKAAAAFGE